MTTLFPQNVFTKHFSIKGGEDLAYSYMEDARESLRQDDEVSANAALIIAEAMLDVASLCRRLTEGEITAQSEGAVLGVREIQSEILDRLQNRHWGYDGVEDLCELLSHKACRI